MPYLGFDGCHCEATHGPGSEQEPSQLITLESRLQLRDCYCGRTGCTETYLSGPGLRRTYDELWGEDRTPEDIAAGSERQALATLELYVEMLARSLAQIVNVFDPAVIVLGGGLSNMRGIYLPVNGRLARYVFSGEFVTEVKPARRGGESGVLGAARLWSDQSVV